MRVGIIGMGARMAVLAPQFAAHSESFEVAAVADPAPDRVPLLTELGFSPDIYSSAEEMLAADRFDLLMIGSVNHQHLAHLRCALESDTPHIFVEKPVVISEAETLELARLAARHDGQNRLIVGLVLRYSPLYRLLRQAQADGQRSSVVRSATATAS
ncbi:MAG: Gfo/Idh/MocA family oxidoreductase [Paracoccaceae bacterium]|nr:Gfo/Idh/MocA family oxidoreductase [Paracoccaceae bacterium]